MGGSPAGRPGSVSPLGAQRFEIQLTADGQLVAKLKEAEALEDL